MARPTISIDGLDEIRETLKDVGTREGRNIMRATIRAIAAKISKAAKQNAPVDSGDMKASIKLKQRKSKPDNPVFEVWAGSKTGAKFDAFYWRFVEYGTKTQPARPFIQPAADEVRAQLPGILREEFGKKWEKALARKRKKLEQAQGND